MYEEYHDTPVIPDDDTQADMYTYAAEFLERYGFKRYEISNFAPRGFDSMHNRRYWKQEDYMGFGPGAHSYVGGLRYSYVRDLKEYIDGVMNGGEIVDEYEKIAGLEVANEYVMLRLRLAEGISDREYLQRFGVRFSEKYRAVLDKYLPLGHILEEGDVYRLSESGMRISNAILVEMLP